MPISSSDDNAAPIICVSAYFGSRLCWEVLYSFFAYLPLPIYIYNYIFTLSLYRIDIGVFLRYSNRPKYTFRGYYSAYL